MPVIVTLHQADCRILLPSLADGSVDTLITDPPYPEIARRHGRLTEDEWFDLMQVVFREGRRLLTPYGSMVFILQPNYRTIGATRTWLWKFLLWGAEEWNLIEDVYWWNSAALPNAGCERHNGLLRRSVKPCLWFGPPDGYRDQDAVLWEESQWNAEQRARERFGRANAISGNGRDRSSISSAAVERGGVTPFNLLIVPATGHTNRGNRGHDAATPFAVCNWWVRYLTPPGGTVLDPFSGTGTVGIAAVRSGRNYVGIDVTEGYLPIARDWFTEEGLHQGTVEENRVSLTG